MKTISRYILCTLAIASLSMIGGCAKKDLPAGDQIAVTSSYLESVLNDLTEGAAEVFCVVPPGMCPGHFDLTPEQLRQLTRSRVLVRFDFQGGLDTKLRRAKTPVVSVEGLAGLCIPETYVQTCRQVVQGLKEHGCMSGDGGKDAVVQIEKRLEGLAGEIRRQVADSGLAGANVIASRHQSAFAEWLGLKVVAQFGSADAVTPAQIAECLQRGRDKQVSLVIANLQEGTELAQQIARELNGRLVVFSNFPDMRTDGTGGFDRLLKSNADNLLAAWRGGQ